MIKELDKKELTNFFLGETIQTCLSALDKCIEENIQPFFLNLLGERYGWIPNDNQIPQGIVTKYNWIHGFSITAMEIVYGAFCRTNPNALFMIRGKSSLEKLPDSFKSNFEDSDPASRQKLQVLKEKLQEYFPSTKKKINCLYFNLKWI